MDLFLRHFSQYDRAVHNIAFAGPNGIDKSSLLEAVLGKDIHRSFVSREKTWLECRSPDLPGIVCYDWNVKPHAVAFKYESVLPTLSCLFLLVDLHLKQIDHIVARACHNYGIPCGLVYCTDKREPGDEMLRWGLRQAARRDLRDCKDIDLDVFILSPLDLFQIRMGSKQRGRLDELFFLSWCEEARTVAIYTSTHRYTHMSPYPTQPPHISRHTL
eukprot:Blabericola_migrator_1__1398@NODE_1364_length_4709_cov_70_595648_g916_i0_p3_GENE_NODE_1364_length_4709_cov_70_595648_g916_i0NODE_1364_length_4709_cov_70_595648_g916_i0_p3_ORF_typecomplete_len216_score22_86IIGP/PF05049_13/0_00017MMR_HSR1/PF01926_23/0_25_NODE_1364_length_4709_cov_70_595648_g916_i025113158